MYSARFWAALLGACALSCSEAERVRVGDDSEPWERLAAVQESTQQPCERRY